MQAMQDKVLLTTQSAFLCLTRAGRGAMPLYGLGYSVRVYQFAPDVALNSSQIQAEGGMGMGRGGVGAGTAVPTAAAAGKSHKSINL